MRCSKKRERESLRIQDLCYDNRIYILNFLPYCNQFRLGDGPCFKYKAETHSLCYYGYLRHDAERHSRVYFKDSLGFILKHIYGYFASDTMRKIYLVEYRFAITLYVDDKPSKHLTVRFRDITPFKLRGILRCHITCQLNNSIGNIGYDFSGLSLSSLSISTYDDWGNLLEEASKMKSFRLDYLSINLTDSKMYNLDLALFNRVARKPRWLFVRNDCLQGFKINNDCEREISRRSNLEKIIFIFNDTITQFPKQFFYSFYNLKSITIVQIFFSDSLEKNTFFMNLRKYSPRLVRIYMFEVVVKKTTYEGVDEDNELRILCQKDELTGVSPNCFAVKYDEEIKKNLHLLNFQNNDVRFFIMNNSKINNNVASIPLDISFFSRFYRLFPNLKALGFRNLSLDESVFKDLPLILQKLPDHVERIEMLFPRYDCSEELMNSSIIPLSSRVRVLSISFKNIADLLEIIFGSFQKLDTLIINDIRHFGESSIQETEQSLSLTKEHLILLRDRMTNLHKLRFCFENGEPLIYFLKYCARTEHVTHARTKHLPSRLSEDFIPEEAEGEEENNRTEKSNPFFFKNNCTHRKYFSDILFFNHFERGTEYFLLGTGEGARLKSYVERRRENEEFEFREKKTKNRRKEGNRSLVNEIRWESTWVYPNLEHVLRSMYQDDSIARVKLMSSFRVHFVKNGNVQAFLSFGLSINEIFRKDLFQDNIRIRSSFASPFDENLHFTTTFCHFEGSSEEDNPIARTWVKVSEFTLFGKVHENGVNRYEFLHPYTLDYLRFCFSCKLPTEEEEDEEEEEGSSGCTSENSWISRKDFIRLVCSMVGVDIKNGRLCIAYLATDEDSSTVRYLDVTWIFRECQRVYDVEFEELEGDSVDFVDAMFEK